MWSYSPGQSKESSDDERSNPRVLRRLQNSRWVWFVCNVNFCLEEKTETLNFEVFYVIFI